MENGIQVDSDAIFLFEVRIWRWCDNWSIGCCDTRCPSHEMAEKERMCKAMDKIKDTIKVVFWDLDDTIWRGTLAENDEITLIDHRIEIIRKLNARGIVNSICSKNDFEKAQRKLEYFGIWELFVFPCIAFMPKGEMIKSILKSMNLRENNALFIDDNEMNLREVEFYNPNISILNSANCDNLLQNPLLAGKNDEELSRFKQYKCLEKKVEIQKKYQSNEQFLKESHVGIELEPYEEKYFERVFELSERTNQLNFTKNRMDKEKLHSVLKKKEYRTFIVHVVDDFGDYGDAGFYTIEGDKLLHFVFSCRIMNMGIEQYIYCMLGKPKINIVGEVASEINQDIVCPDWIKIVKNEKGGTNENSDIETILKEESKLTIFGLGACDLYHAISHFAMPNQEFTYECNVFKGKERGVNVGTEYIRSIYEMTESEKRWCTSHLNNYTGSLAFHSKIFAREYDYIIMSFHDDMIFKIYEKKDNPNIKIVMSPSRKFGDTSVIGENGELLTFEDTYKFLEKNFKKGEYITEERFYENLVWIKNHTGEKTKIILVTGPELDFFRKNNFHCEEVRNQIIRLNQVLYRIEKEFPKKFAVADINSCVRSKDDVTDYVFHLKAQTAYNLFVQIVWTIIRKFLGDTSKPGMLSHVVNNREVVIFGNSNQARNAFYNLKLGGMQPAKYVHFDFQNRIIGTMKVLDSSILIEGKEKYYVVVADDSNYGEIEKQLNGMGYESKVDYCKISPRTYKKVWNESL